MKRLSHIEVKFQIDHVPYVAQGSGESFFDLLQSAEYSVDCPDPEKFIHISELPQKTLNYVMEEFREKYAGSYD